MTEQTPQSPQPTAAKPLALVTGASAGIGYELAVQFAQNGFDLVVAAEDEAITAAATSLQEHGATVVPVRVDLTDPGQVERLATETEALGRPLDAVALNAGVAGKGGPFLDVDLTDHREVIDLNITSTVHLAHRVLPAMVARGQGKVLFTSSVVSRMPAPFEAVYGASKAFVESLSQALRNELKDTGVTVTALLPGPTETEFFERGEMLDTKVGSAKKDDPAQVAKQGFEGLMKGKDHVIAGSLKTRLQSHVAAVMPDTAGAAQHRSMSEPGSGGA